MRFQYRVTKYNPERRNSSGAYLEDEWTSRSDIGKLFAGVMLTEEQYLDMEQAYIDAALAFLGNTGTGALRVIGLENYRNCYSAPAVDELVSLDSVPDLLRAMLREEYWCKLESISAFIHVGYDYCMYIGVDSDCASARNFAERRGLFVENFRSPYSES
jgi:hypothetical protein